MNLSDRPLKKLLRGLGLPATVVSDVTKGMLPIGPEDHGARGAVPLAPSGVVGGVTDFSAGIRYSATVMIGRTLLVLSLALSLSAQEDPRTMAANLRAGESVNGMPNWAERVILQWMNRARVEPQTEMAACGSACGDAACYKPMPPLVWDQQLNQSARFHADEMIRQHFFSHDSQCSLVANIGSLYPVACDGSAACACSGPGSTSWTRRVALFGAGPSGEIIAGTADPNSAFYLWLYEVSASPSCGFGSNGHRWLILNSIGAVGVGASGYTVGDFGGGATPYKIPSAAHFPKQAETVTLWANWFDTAAPRSANAVVDGRCSPLILQRGSPQNGSWSGAVSGVGSGCHRYYFTFVDSSGAELTYPATGSLGIGGAACEDWDPSRLTARCLNSVPPPPAAGMSKSRAVRHR